MCAAWTNHLILKSNILQLAWHFGGTITFLYKIFERKTDWTFSLKQQRLLQLPVGCLTKVARVWQFKHKTFFMLKFKQWKEQVLV